MTGPSPVNRSKKGSKHHIVVERKGIPLAVVLSAANRNDCQMLEDLLDAVVPVRGRQGRPRQRPDKLDADKGYDYRKCRSACRKRGIKHRIARKGVESKKKLGRHRWVVERTLSWLHAFRRLRTRWDRRLDRHLAFSHLACALIAARFLDHE